MGYNYYFIHRKTLQVLVYFKQGRKRPQISSKGEKYKETEGERDRDRKRDSQRQRETERDRQRRTPL